MSVFDGNVDIVLVDPRQIGLDTVIVIGRSYHCGATPARALISCTSLP